MRQQWIWDEVREISGELWRDPASSEGRARWSALWREAIDGDRSSQTDVDDVGIIVHVGWMIASADGDHAAALDVLQPYLKHPNIEHSDEDTRAGLGCNFAESLLSLGREAEAAEAYAVLLNDLGRPAVRLAVARIGTVLWRYCSGRRPSEEASDSLSGLVNRVIDRLPRRRSRRRKLEGPVGYGELASQLDKALPAESRPVDRNNDPVPHKRGPF